MGLLATSSGWGGLTSGLDGELLTRSLSSCILPCQLGTCHLYFLCYWCYGLMRMLLLLLLLFAVGGVGVDVGVGVADQAE